MTSVPRPALTALGGLVLIVPSGVGQAEELQTVVAEDTFLGESETWTGGTASEGVLLLDDAGAVVNLTAATTFSARLLLRQRDAAALTMAIWGRGATSAGELSWTADYADGGGITFSGSDGAEEIRHFPYTHRSWTPDDEPALEGEATWEGGSLLHSEIHRDVSSGVWTLFYTGVMSSGYGYRQIGLATSPDGETWTKNPDNPVITIDYSHETIDGIHAHMPSVVVDDDGTWHMYYACYQNSVGNRICHATSADGTAWTRPDYGEGRMAIDLGESGAFDDASLREPEVAIAEDGSFKMFYVGTQADEHYGPAGLAESTDGGWTWERVAKVTSGESELQGGSLLQSVYGLEHWYQCGPYICFAESLPDDETGELDWTEWTMYGDEPVLSPGWMTWNQSYIQAPTVALDADGRTLHMWFNANNYDVNVEVLGHARSVPRPDVWSTLDLAWDGSELSVSWDGGEPHSTQMVSLESLTLSTSGAAELDEARLEWTEVVDEGEDTGTEDTGAGDDGGDEGGDDGGSDGSGTDTDAGDDGPPVTEDPEAGCAGCATGGGPVPASAVLVFGLLGLWTRRRG